MSQPNKPTITDRTSGVAMDRAFVTVTTKTPMPTVKPAAKPPVQPINKSTK